MALLSESAFEMMAEGGIQESALHQAVEAAVREHSRFVFRLAYSILRNHDDAEDATQEVFMRVLKNKDKLADVRETKLWLAKIAWRVTLDWKKSLDRRRPAEKSDVILAMIASTAQSADQAIVGKQMSALLEKMIATIPADLRETLALSTVHELNATEIAAILNIPESSVRTRLLRARTLLRQKMSAVIGEPNA